MKIVMLGQFHKIWDEEGKAKTFEELGHTVYRYEEASFTHEDILDIYSKKPDLVLVAKMKIHQVLAVELIGMCRENKIKIVTWHPDLYFGQPREHYVNVKPHFQTDLVLSPDGGNDKKWKQAGVNHKVLRQGVCKEDCYIGDVSGKHYDIIFVGTDNPAWPYRLKLAGFLWENYGQKFHWFGRGDSDEVRGKDLNDLIACSKIVIGDSVDSPKYWSNRIYETIGRGGFTIHPMIEGLEKEYTPYKHFVPYDYGDFKGLKEKIDYFLTQPDERAKIALEGQVHTILNLTLVSKCRELLELIK